MTPHTSLSSWPAAIVLALWLCFPLLSWAQAKQVQDAPLAKVNGVAITSGMLRQEVHMLQLEMAQRRSPLSSAEINNLRNRMVETLIERELLYQQAQSQRTTIRSQWVAETLDALQERVGGRARLASHLSAGRISQDELIERLRKGLVVRQLLQGDPLRGIRVTQDETRRFYDDHPELFQGVEQFRARHILIAVPNPNDRVQNAAALDRIRQLQSRITAGTPLSVLALDHSDCPSRSRGGALGYLPTDQMIAPFAEAVASLAVNQVSDIVRTQQGYHLIQLIDRQPPRPIPYHRVRVKIERTLRWDKEQAAVQAYVARLKRQAELIR
ncbi:MAG: peptidylprolyl isomerase [Desulfatitalea sp.]|nr:peptidylprolyl isomerase [Desulfatitalea sp.]